MEFITPENIDICEKCTAFGLMKLKPVNLLMNQGNILEAYSCMFINMTPEKQKDFLDTLKKSQVPYPNCSGKIGHVCIKG